LARIARNRLASAVVQAPDAPTVPFVGCLSGMMTGPATLAPPRWMWAATGVSMPVALKP
jgi:hypothetical protein